MLNTSLMRKDEGMEVICEAMVNENKKCLRVQEDRLLEVKRLEIALIMKTVITHITGARTRASADRINQRRKYWPSLHAPIQKYFK